jgi:hypothetical protein
VRTPAAAFKPTISSEDVSTCTRITGIFFAARSFAFLFEKHSNPTAAPGDAAKPFAITRLQELFLL